MKILLFAAVTFLFASSSIAQSESDSTLNWPDTTDWVEVRVHQPVVNLKFKLPDGMKYYAHTKGITLFINDNLSYSIVRDENESDFSMTASKERLQSSEFRENLVWKIDEENMAYYVGDDTSAPAGYTATHSGYAKKTVAGRFFHIKIDSITLSEGVVYSLSEEETLTLLTIFNSMYFSM